MRIGQHTTLEYTTPISAATYVTASRDTKSDRMQGLFKFRNGDKTLAFSLDKDGVKTLQIMLGEILEDWA